MEGNSKKISALFEKYGMEIPIVRIEDAKFELQGTSEPLEEFEDYEKNLVEHILGQEIYFRIADFKRFAEAVSLPKENKELPSWFVERIHISFRDRTGKFQLVVRGVFGLLKKLNQHLETDGKYFLDKLPKEDREAYEMLKVFHPMDAAKAVEGDVLACYDRIQENLYIDVCLEQFAFELTNLIKEHYLEEETKRKKKILLTNEQISKAFAEFGMNVSSKRIQEITEKTNELQNGTATPKKYRDFFVNEILGMYRVLEIQDFETFRKRMNISDQWRGAPSWFTDELVIEYTKEHSRGGFGNTLNPKIVGFGLQNDKGNEFIRHLYQSLEKDPYFFEGMMLTEERESYLLIKTFHPEESKKTLKGFFFQKWLELERESFEKGGLSELTEKIEKLIFACYTESKGEEQDGSL